MSSNNLGSIYATTISSEKYIIINSQNIELSGNVILKNGLNISNGLLNTNYVVPNITNSASLGSTSKIWSNAYIRDISATNIELSGNIVPLNANSSSLGSGVKLWSNAYINDVSATNIELSGNIVPLNANSSRLGSALKLWSNAYISDVSVSNIELSGNIVPLNANSSNLGSALKLWSNAYISDVSATNIELSGNIVPLNANSSRLGSALKTWSNAYIRDISVSTIELSGNIVPLNANSSNLGSALKQWSNAYINDVSVSNIELSGNIVPLNANSSRLGSSVKPWSNVYMRDISVSTIELSGNIVPLNANSSSLGSSSKRWNNIFVNELSITNINGQVYSAGGGGSINLTSITSNIVPSTTNTYSLGSTTRNWSNAYIRDLKVSNRAYQEISGDISWSAVNGHYGLTKDAYPALNPSSSGVKAVQTWTSRSSAGQSFYGICWSPGLGLFVATNFSSGSTIISSNGIIWTPITLPTSAAQVCWSQELRIFIAAGAAIMRSDNGIDWAIVGSYSSCRTVCWSPQLSLFVAVTNGGSNNVITSRNGTSWSPMSVVSSEWSCICWSPELGLFVAVSASSGRVMTSNNGSLWNQITVSYTGQWATVCWSSALGLFVSLTNDGKGMTSNNGTSWTVFNIPAGSHSVCWSPELELFVASSTNYISTSVNGVNWTARSIDTGGQPMLGVCWSPELGIFAFAGIGGRISTSSLKGRPPTSSNVFDGSFTSIPMTITTTSGGGTGGTGGTITTSGGFSIHSFTTVGSNTFTPSFTGTVQVLIVGGGGGGGGGGYSIGGGGGGGGVIYIPSVNVTAGTGYQIVVGDGGASFTNGQNSSAFTAIAAGGGTGGLWPSTNGSNGGSGGGAGATDGINFAFTPNTGGTSSNNSVGNNSNAISYGNNGGSATTIRTGVPTRAAGGGGAGGNAVNTDSNIAGDTGQTGAGSGGVGITNAILGTSYYWAGGGGGGAYSHTVTQTGGYGGWGGGGGGAGGSNGGNGGGNALNSGVNGIGGPNTNGGVGGLNTGGGGGGGNYNGGAGGKGGSGIVVIRYTSGYTYTYELNNTIQLWEWHRTNALTVPGRTLAVISNATQNEQVRLMVSRDTWLGGKRRPPWSSASGVSNASISTDRTSLTWEWDNGEPWIYYNWDSGEPGGSEDRVKIQTNGFWHDYPSNNYAGPAVYMTVTATSSTATTTVNIPANGIDETGKWTFANVAVSGTITAGGAGAAVTSDDRLKHNEVIITNGLAVIDKLCPKFYQKTQVMLDASYNGDLSGQSWNYEAGLIAQEVLQSGEINFVVSGGDYYEPVMNYDLSINDLSVNDLSVNDLSINDLSVNNLNVNDLSKNLIKQPYALNYNSIFTYGVAAIKELHTKVKAQETNILDQQLNSLITRIETLETSGVPIPIPNNEA